MSKIRLFIENKEVELTNDVQFSITKQFIDFNNPTTICNTWSKSISIPFSENNNKIFGNAFSPDKAESIVNVYSLPLPDTYVGEWDDSTKTLTTEFSEYYINLTIGNPLSLNEKKVDGIYDKSGKYSLDFKSNGESMLCLSFRDALYKQTYSVTWNNLSLISGKKYKISFEVSFGIPSTLSNIMLEEYLPNVGLGFNCTDKFDFRLEQGDNVIMEGYGKLNSVTRKNGSGTYNVNLFGMLGKVLNDIKNITFDKSSDNHEAIIDTRQYYNESMNKDLVNDAWEYRNNSTDLLTTDESGYNKNNVIGFAPTASFNENFDYTQEVSYDTKYKSDSITDLLNENDNFKTLGIDSKTFFADGKLNSLEYGNFPSYTQIPYIYFNQLFQIWQKKAEQMTGYKIVLDNSWFNNSNPMWKNLIFMLDPSLKKEDDIDKKVNSYRLTTSEYIVTGGSTTYTNWKNNYTKKWDMSVTVLPNAVFNNEQVYFYNSSSNKFMCDKIIYAKINEYNKVFNVVIEHRVGGTPSPYTVLHFYKNTFKIDLVLNTQGLSDKIIVGTYILVDSGMNSEYRQSIIDRYGINSSINMIESSFKWFSGDTFRNSFDIDLSNLVFYTNFGETSLSFEISVLDDGEDNFNETFAVYVGGGIPLTSNICNTFLGTRAGLSSDIKVDIFSETNGRTYSQITISDMWNMEYSIFDEIIKYCKANRILLYVDDINKSINFETPETYFSNMIILNMDNDINLENDFSIEYILSNYKYLTFNYDKNESALDKQYKEAYGINYGAKKVKTPYNFNESEDVILNLDKSSKLVTLNYRQINDLKRGDIINRDTNIISFVDASGEDNKFISIFGSYYFVDDIIAKARIPFDIKIQDDPIGYVSNTNAKTYNVIDGCLKSITYFPYIKTEMNDCSVHLNNPLLSYAKTNSPMYVNKTSIYDKRWSNYIQEIYNIQNKKITCYVKLPFDLFKNNKMNAFFIIDNQLCFLNKVIDYDITSNMPTKVELITVQNLNAYK